jgi:hypothetical protein
MRMWNFLGKMLAKIQAKIASCGEPQILAIPHKACIGLLTQSAVTKCYIRTVRHELPDHLIIDRIEPYGDSR